MKISENGKKLFSYSPKEHIFKKLAYWVVNCDLYQEISYDILIFDHVWVGD